MKTVLLLVLLFVGSNALRSNHLRKGTESEMSEAQGTGVNAGKIIAAKKMAAAKSGAQEGTGANAGKIIAVNKMAAAKSGAQEGTGAGQAPSGDNVQIEYPPITDEHKKLLAIHDKQAERVQKLIAVCLIHHKNCYEKAGDDEAKRMECDGAFEREEREGVRKIHDECAKEIDSVAGETIKNMKDYSGSEEEKDGELLREQIKDEVFGMVQKKFENFFEKIAKRIDGDNLDREEIRIKLEDIGSKVHEENREEVDKFEQFGSAWVDGEFEKFQGQLKERMSQQDAKAAPATKIRQELRKAFRQKIRQDVRNYLDSNEEFKAGFEKFQERVRELVWGQFQKRKEEKREGEQEGTNERREKRERRGKDEGEQREQREERPEREGEQQGTNERRGEQERPQRE